MDMFCVAAVADELAALLCGAAIKKIHQPGADQVVIRLWNGRMEFRLLLSVQPQAARVHLTSLDSLNPFIPPRFCQLLRSRLGRLVRISHVHGERLLQLDFTGEGRQEYRLVAELFGRRPNLILLDERGTIVDALNRQPDGRRPVMAGLAYALPERGRRWDLGQGLPVLPDFPEGGGGFSQWLMDQLSPMTALAARDLEAAVEAGGSPLEALERFRDDWISRRWRPQVGRWRGQWMLSALPLQQLVLEDATDFEGISAALDHYYRMLQTEPGMDSRRMELEQAVRRRLLQLEKRRHNIESQELVPEQLERKRRIGELLLAQLFRVRQGMSEVELEDYYADPPGMIRVDLDPRLSPQANAERYFMGFKKGRRGAEHVERRLQETQQEIQWMQGVELALSEAACAQDLLSIRVELEEAGMLSAPKEPETRRRRIDPKEQLRHCKSPGGFDLYWGRNNRTNDYVSRDLTSGEDLWFHAHGMPGCHLVLKRAGAKGEIPVQDLLYAASVAAGYSRGRHEGRVEVMYTEGRQVRRPKGGRPGLVVVESFRTLAVEPKRID